jgi:hypothetical protein
VADGLLRNVGMTVAQPEDLAPQYAQALARIT